MNVCRESIDGLLKLHMFEMCEVFTTRLRESFVPFSEAIEWDHYDLESSSDSNQIWLSINGLVIYSTSEPKVMIIRVPLILALSDDVVEIDKFLSEKKQMMESSTDPEINKPSEIEQDIKRVVH